MDTLRLNGLQYHARHGFYEEERTKGNEFEIDLEFTLDLRSAGQTDDLTQTVNYENVESTVNSVMEGPSKKLIETLTHLIGEALFEQFPEVQLLQVSLRKLNPPLQTKTKFSEVTMTWQRQL